MATSGEQTASQAVGTAEPAMATPTSLAATSADGVLKHLMAEHVDVFALIKRLGTRSSEQLPGEHEQNAAVRAELLSSELGEMAALYTALSEIVRTELSSDSHEDSDLVDAVAALGALNPGSPEWGPAFLHVSELVEARVAREEQAYFPKVDERRSRLTAC
jgi:hypothetical protein